MILIKISLEDLKIKYNEYNTNTNLLQYFKQITLLQPSRKHHARLERLQEVRQSILSIC